MVRALWLGLALALTSVPAAGAGERARATLEWQSPEDSGCLESADLRKAVEERLHRTVFVPEADADLHVKVALRGAPSEWWAEIHLADSSGRSLGHRQLSARTAHCSSLDDSLALVVALMVDLRKEDVQPRESMAPPAPISLPETEIRLPPTTVAPREPWGGALFAVGRLSVGQLPGIGTGIGLAAEIRPPHDWVFGLGVTAWMPAETSGRPGGRFWLASAEIDICRLLLQRARTELGLCIGQQVGYLHSQALGFDANSKADSLLYALGAQLRGAWWITRRFGLRLGVGATVPLSQDEFFGTRADGSKVSLLRRAPAVAGTDLGVGLRW